MTRRNWDDDLSILSAENVHFALETAGLGSRFAAVAIDMTLQLLALMLLGLAGRIAEGYLPAVATWSQLVLSLGRAFLGLIVFLILYGYFFLFEWLMDGQTPGKRWLGLRVLQTSGMPLTVWPAMTRNLLRIIDFLPFFYGVGCLVTAMNPLNRRAGDLVAGTLVARERSLNARKVLDIGAAADAFLASFTNAPGPTAAAGAADAISAAPSAAVSATAVSATVDAQSAAVRMRLDDQDYELARDFLARRDKLPLPARQRLAQTLTSRLCAKLGHPLPPPAETEQFLQEVAAAFGRGDSR